MECPVRGFTFRALRIWASLSALALLINHWHGRRFSRIPAIILLLSLVLAIPLLFRISKTNVLDRALGELSYPIYICHFSVIWIFEHLFAMHDGAAHGLLSNAITLPVAVLYSG